jgi:hypothetical protein
MDYMKQDEEDERQAFLGKKLSFDLQIVKLLSF